MDKNYLEDLFINEVKGALNSGGGSGATIDATLTVVGAAADAKVTGDAIKQLSEDIGDIAQLAALIETDMLPAVYNTDEKVLTNEQGQIVLRY